MRRRKAENHLRVNGNLRVEFSGSSLTSYAGLELLRRFFALTELNSLIRRHLGSAISGGDFAAVAIIRLFVVLLVLGGRRLRHVDFLKDDPLVKRTTGLRVIPEERTLSRWLKRFRSDSIGRLQSLNADVVLRTLNDRSLGTVTVDIDGTVVSTGLKVGGAIRGYNPHKRKVPSYYPITACLAETGQILRVKNRPGNVHDGTASVAFLRDVMRDLDGYRLTFRMDSAFFLEPVIKLLNRRRAGFTMKVPFWTWLQIKADIAARKRWARVDAEVEFFEKELEVKPWGLKLRTVIYRKKVKHKTRKNYQLDLFDPNDGHYEYSAIATSLSFDGSRLWRLMCGRGNHEKAISELKSGLAFDSIPTNRYSANSAWQQMSVLAHNLLIDFQIRTGSPQKPRSWKRTALFLLKRVQTLRFELFHRAGILVRPGGAICLRMNDNPAARGLFDRIASALSHWRSAA